MEQRSLYQRPGRKITYLSQSCELPDLRAQVDWMKAALAQSLQSALKDLDRAFRSFIEGRAGFPRYKRKGDRDSFHLPGKADLGFKRSGVVMLWWRKHPKRKGTLSSLGAICWLTAALLLPTAAADAAQKRVALVIGNSGYVHMSGRSNSKQDAANISGALDGLGFQVIAAYDLDKAGFDTRTAEFGRALAGADVGVFFFAGRGVQIAGRNYLVPIDAQSLTVQKLDALTVPLDLVYALLEGRAKTKILLIDADRNNSLTTDSADPKSKETRALAIPKMGVGTLISFSTQPGNVALEGSGGNSPYVAALLRRITIAGQDLAGLLDAVRNDVRTATNNKQIPWYQSSLQEKFYFVQSSPTK